MAYPNGSTTRVSKLKTLLKNFTFLINISILSNLSPNTCAVEEVPELNRRLWTECKYWLRRQICGYQP
jgi:hypothetical protein